MSAIRARTVPKISFFIMRRSCGGYAVAPPRAHLISSYSTTPGCGKTPRFFPILRARRCAAGSPAIHAPARWRRANRARRRAVFDDGSGLENFLEMADQPVERQRCAAADVDDLARRGARLERQEIGLHDVVHVGKVARLLAVAEHRQRLAA